MGFDATVAVATIIVIFVTIQVRRRTPTDLLFLGGLVVVTLCGVITPEQALKGFSNPAILTIGSLLVCAAGLRSTGLLDWVGEKLLGTAKSERPALRRLASTTVAASAFVLNTALVAMLMPVVLDWCRRRSISPSRVLIPVSYLAILGGVCTLVGTSTTIVANAILHEQHQRQLSKVERLSREQPNAEKQIVEEAAFADAIRPMSLFEIGKAGLPCAIVGSIVLIVLAPRLLPDRRDMVEQLGKHRREFLVEMGVQADCRLIGRTVEAAGLRQLPGLFLIEINRAGEIITPVTPKDIIRAHDRLVFTGIVSTIVDLERIPGLVPADEGFEDHPETRAERHLTEVVLSPSCPLIGTTVRDGSFRQRYNAAIVAIHRNGVRLTHKIGDIELESGDTLLLQTRSLFVRTYRHSRDFYLVSSVEGNEPRRHDRAGWAAGLACLLIAWLVVASFLPKEGSCAGFSSHAIAALAVAGLMIVMRCLRISQARAAIDLPLLLTIAGAIGLGNAIDVSEADVAIATYLVWLVPNDPLLLLVIIYVLAMVFTEMITNNAVATTLLPLAIATAHEGGYNPRPFVMAISLAASLAFLTPIGYQTNLMVMGPGGYRASDYLRLGIPLAAVVAVTALFTITRVWSF